MKQVTSLILTIFITVSSFAQPVRNWGTYYGGTGNEDYGFSVTTDANGNVYMTGYTNSSTGISTIGSHQPAYGGGYDAFLVKFNSAGVRQWATYYGGSGNDVGYSVAVDASGNVYVTGYAQSTSGISTVGSHQAAFGGGTFDVFLVKFSSGGVRQWATYYGGGGSDVGMSVAIDGTGNIYVGGYTGSTTAISTVGCHQPTHGGGGDDAFLAKFNSAGVRQWGTYYGGSGTNGDYGHCVAVDGSSNVYLTGYTYSANNISTVGSHQVNNNGTGDAFVVKFSSSGVRQWGTYYGGAAGDAGNAVAVDASGNVYVSGSTQSTTDISTSGSHQPVYSAWNEAFLVKFNSAGARQWGTYYGGTNSEWGTSVSIDGSGMAYLAGYTYSANAISTTGSYQPLLGGGGDAYLAKFDGNGVRQWGTYYGGSGEEVFGAVGIAPNGTIYLAGSASSTSSISTVGSHQPAYGGGTQDGFLVQFDGCALAPSQPGTISGPATVCNGYPYTYSIAPVNGATSYTWTLPSGWTGTSTTNIINTTASANSGTITVTANNACGSSLPQTLPVTPSNISVTYSATASQVCQGGCVTLTGNATGGTAPYTYTWSTPSPTYGSAITICPTSTICYTLTATDANGCTGNYNTSICVTVYPSPNITATGGGLVCEGSSVCFGATGGISYNWTGPCGFSSTQQNPCIASIGSGCGGTYTVTGTDGNGCSNTSTVNVFVNPPPNVTATNTGPVCLGNGTLLTASGANIYSWQPGNMTGAAVNVMPTVTTIYTVTGTAGNGCTNTATTTVTVNPLPVVTYVQSPGFMCVNWPVQTLSPGTPSGGTYSGTAVTSNTFDPAAAGAGTHYIIYTYTDGNGCTNSDSSVISVGLCTGLNEADSGSNVSVYPNPFQSNVTVFMSTREPAQIELYNVPGEMIFRMEAPGQKTEITLDELPGGIYFIRVITAGKTVAKKISKE